MATVDEIDQPEEIKDCLKQFSKNPQGFLLLSGWNGTGKTYAAEAVFNSFYCPDSDYHMFTTQTDLNLRWQKQIKEWGETTYLLNQVIMTKLLVLDDIGTRVPTEAFMDFLYAVIEKRDRNRALVGTVITTNMNSSDMRLKFGDAFTSRVASGKCFRLESKDRRFKDW